MLVLETPFGQFQAESLEELTKLAKSAEVEHKKKSAKHAASVQKAAELAKADAYYMLVAKLRGEVLPMYDLCRVAEATESATLIDGTLTANTRHGEGSCLLFSAHVEKCAVDSAGNVRGVFLIDDYYPMPNFHAVAAVDGALALVLVPQVAESDFAELI